MTDQPNYGFTPGPGGPPGFTPGPQGMPQPPHQHPPGNGMAIAGLVLGILALLLCWIPFLNWILAILGIIFGAVGMSKANKIGGRGKGLAVTGLVLGILGAVIGTILVVMIMKESRGSFRRGRFGEVTVPVQQHIGAVIAPAPDRLR